ncbi:MAG: hypothetical protein ACHQKY_05620 [Terriglobia bacterium]
MNLIWVHLGRGFFVEEDEVIARPGEVILFDRSRLHWVNATVEYVRTVVTTIPRNQEKKYPRFLWNGVFYEDSQPILGI